MQLDHALHGYSGGHRLLASSAAFSRNLKHALLVASDWSGSSRAEGFDEYLTGYPVEDEGVYVLARTWYASEMARPGCVWTHSLVISPASLGNLEDLTVLQPLFLRPTSGDSPGLSPFREPLSVPALRHSGHVAVDAALAAQVLSALYSKPFQPVLLAARSSEAATSLCLAIWRQQWPRLRRSFRFCTGSLADRGSTLGHAFDLQVVPTRRAERVRREVDGAVLVQSQGESKFAPEIKYAVEDLPLVSSELRRFLWRYGLDASKPRRVFLPLVRVFRELYCKSDSANPSTVLDTPDSANPSTVLDTLTSLPPGEGNLLREGVFGRSDSEGSFNEYQKLRCLGTHHAWNATGVSVDEMTDRVCELLETDRGKALNLVSELLNNKTNSLGKATLRFMERALTLNDLAHLETLTPGAVVKFVRSDTRRQRNPDVWRRFASLQNDLILAIAPGGASDGQVILAILESLGPDRTSAPASPIAQVGAPAVLGVLDAVMEDPEALRRLPDGWLHDMRSFVNEIAEWLHRRAEPVPQSQWALLGSALSGEEQEILQIPSATWTVVLPGDLGSLKKKQRVALSAFFFTVGMVSKQAVPGLLRLSFSVLHEAAAHSRISDDSWAVVGKHLPDQEKWRLWDKCELLRRALITRFMAAKWSRSEFVASISASTRDFADVLISAKALGGGLRYLQSIRMAADSGELSLTGNQYKALSEALRPPRRRLFPWFD